MAISKGRIPQELHAGFVQPCYLYGNDMGGGASLQVLDPSASLEFFCHESSKGMLEDSGSLELLVDYYTTVSKQPSLSEPNNSSSSSSFAFGAINSRPVEPRSVLTFESASGYSFCNVPMISFEQENQANSLELSYGDDSVASWAEAIFPSHQVLRHLHQGSGSTDHRVAQEPNCFKGTHGHGAAVNGVKEHQREEGFGCRLSSEERHDNILQENRGPMNGGAHKRPCMDDDAPSSKRQCTASNRKSKPKAVTSKNTQSIAAKNRRERISERLKVLQALIPNGTKVDLVTMLEKAISYVKFLQLQVKVKAVSYKRQLKVLSTDEFWPAQGGKTPEVAQVNEAIDAILSSHKERNLVTK